MFVAVYSVLPFVIYLVLPTLSKCTLTTEGSTSTGTSGEESTLFSLIEESERNKFKIFKSIELEGLYSIPATSLKQFLITLLTPYENLNKKIEEELDQFNFNSDLAKKIVKWIKRLADNKKGKTIREFIVGIMRKLAAIAALRLETSEFSQLFKQFMESAEFIEDQHHDNFETKVFRFYYLWIWRFVDFLDKDGKDRIKFVEDNKNFDYFPGRVFGILFADWLQRDVIPGIESKFISNNGTDKKGNHLEPEPWNRSIF